MLYTRRRDPDAPNALVPERLEQRGLVPEDPVVAVSAEVRIESEPSHHGEPECHVCPPRLFGRAKIPFVRPEIPDDQQPFEACQVRKDPCRGIALVPWGDGAPEI